jgi:hypothetical protein
MQQDAIGDVSAVLDGPGYQGALPPCADVDPIAGVDIQIKVEQLQAVANGDGTYRAVVDAARLDVSPSCGHRVIVTSYAERFAPAVGTVLRVRQHTVPYPSATSDIAKSTLVMTDVAGGVMLVSAISVTPPNIDDTLLPGFGLSVDDAALCSWGSAGSSSELLSVHVTQASADCVLASGTERCCTLADSNLEALVQSAARTMGQDPAVLIDLTLRRAGLFVHAP